jgi:glycosyltransferase involved in cell wall biosynthesis
MALASLLPYLQVLLPKAGIPVNAIEYYNGGYADFEHVAANTRGVHLTRSASEPVNLYVANADCTPDILLKIPPQVFRHKYNIGYWAWELDVFPYQLMKHLKVYDEIWVPSRFVADSIQNTTGYDGTVIRVLPIPVQEPMNSIDGASSSLEVEQLPTIPDTGFVFLVTFDFWSMQERKNPVAAVRAFMDAFPVETSMDIYMVVKSTNCNATSAFARYHTYLETLAVNDTRILFVPWQLSDEALGALQQRADCYVSLHRGECYGMNILEALSKGKAVIATNYSGNVDFFSVVKDFVGSCMFPISYDLVTIQHTLGPFHAGSHWAEPNHESAVDAMKKVVISKYSERSREISNLARSHFGKFSIGSRAMKYLEEARASIVAKVCS